jgi:hypothetical protein
MRGEQREGRFSIDHERGSIITGTTKEIVRTVGNVIEWWLYDQPSSVVDPIYDVGANTGGRRWTGPYKLPVINASIVHGVSMHDQRGFYNTDVLRITMNMDIIDGSGLAGGEKLTVPELRFLPTNPDSFMRDRVVFRKQVFQIKQVQPRGILTNDYTLFSMDLTQVNSEELVNDPQFSEYANYNAFNSRSTYYTAEGTLGLPGGI